MADLYIGDYELLDGYVNNNMVTSLLCEGDLARNHGWQFLSAGNKKLCMTPQGNFVAARHGNLHFWPVEARGLLQDKMQISQQPQLQYPVLPEHTQQIEQALSQVRDSTEETISDSDDEDSWLACCNEVAALKDPIRPSQMDSGAGMTAYTGEQEDSTPGFHTDSEPGDDTEDEEEEPFFRDSDDEEEFMLTMASFAGGAEHQPPEIAHSEAEYEALGGVVGTAGSQEAGNALKEGMCSLRSAQV